MLRDSVLLVMIQLVEKMLNGVMKIDVEAVPDTIVTENLEEPRHIPVVGIGSILSSNLYSKEFTSAPLLFLKLVYGNGPKKNV